MSAMASQITGISIVYSTVCSGADQRKHPSSATLAFVRGIHRWPVNSPIKGPVAPKMFPFDDVIMITIMLHRREHNLSIHANWGIKVIMLIYCRTKYYIYVAHYLYVCQCSENHHNRTIWCIHKMPLRHGGVLRISDDWRWNHIGGLPHEGPTVWSMDAIFVSQNKLLHKQLSLQWSQTYRSRDVTVTKCTSKQKYISNGWRQLQTVW